MPVDAAPTSRMACCMAAPRCCWPKPSAAAPATCAWQADALCVGIEINANHLAAVREGIVTGTARALHVGRSTQVWEIRIEDEDGRLVCISRLTLAVVPRRQR